MTAPQPPAPAQDAAQAASPSTPAPVPAPEAPVAESGGQAAPWPPDEATLLALQMEASFSIIEEPADEDTPGADRQDSSAGTPPPQPQQQAPPPQAQG